MALPVPARVGSGARLGTRRGLGLLRSRAVVHRSGRMPFRQALLMARYMDLVVTPETGLGIGAGAYGTPKIMLLTIAEEYERHW